VVTALQRKLGRDLVSQVGQVVTIAVVIACGIAAFVSMRGTWKSLETSRDLYYQRYRMGDAFAHLSRAPDAVASQLESIDGVAVVHTRLVEPMRVLVPGSGDPPRGYVVSMPADAEPPLGDIWVSRGRMFEPGRDDEAVLMRRFGEAVGIGPGDTLDVVLNGNLRTVRVVGLADSPEYIFVFSPGELLSDPSRFAVLWMDEAVVGPAYQKDGAFDDVVMRLQPGADVKGVLAATDRILAPYGGAGSVAREDQTSHALLEQEMGQLRTLATTLPVIFLAVAAFLVQVVLSRMVQLQRTQIATLKAFGYSRTEIAMHYMGLVAVVGALGALLGLAIGAWFGTEMTQLYAEFFHLPAFAFRIDVELLALAVATGVLATILGAMTTVRGVVVMPPAEAMQPPAPPSYASGWLDRIGFLGLFGPASRMAARDLARRPLRLGMSVTGIAFATAVVVLGRFSDDALGVLEELIFAHMQAEDVSVTFVEEVPEREVRALGALPGVTFVEGQRSVPARFGAGHVHRDGVLIAHPERPVLRRIVTWPFAVVPVPEHGIALTDILGELLDVGVGDTVDLEMLYGAHLRGRLPVTALVSEPIGLQGHVSSETLARLLGESELFNGAFLRVEPGAEAEVVRRLVDVPGVLGASRKSEVVKAFRAQTAESRSVMTFIASSFGAAIAIGVVYNNARIALSQRSRELASLRVLGFTRGEVASIVVGELATQVILGVPLGLWLGDRMARAMMETVDPETWRFPLVIGPQTYVSAALIVIGASAACVGIVWRHVGQLDLVGVLKTRE
jgi:putative ABC transport system permease protein